MPRTGQQITVLFLKVVIFSGLFFAILAALVYIVNLDIRINPKPDSKNLAPIQSTNLESDLRKKLGSTMFSFGSYADWAMQHGLGNDNAGLDLDPDKDQLPNYLEYVHGTDPLNADTDNDKYSDKQEIKNGYDPDAPGDTKPIVEISIPKMNAIAPMVWSLSEDEKNMLKDLERGVIHFNKTATPGQAGNMVISGHSSNYLWAKGNYNHIFRDLNDLEKGDLVTIKTIQKNGRIIAYKYIVSEKFITTADDARIFEDTVGPTMTLSTCWPIGTNLKRIIVKLDLAR